MHELSEQIRHVAERLERLESMFERRVHRSEDDG
jgi:hypothetical protein